MIREDCRELKRRFADARRTEISGEEIGEVDLEDLIEEENMVVSISSAGYIKRTPSSVYRAQRRGGKGLTGAKTEEEDPIEHLFVASTHAYLMFFTNRGKVIGARCTICRSWPATPAAGPSSICSTSARANRSPIAAPCAISICPTIFSSWRRPADS